MSSPTSYKVYLTTLPVTLTHNRNTGNTVLLSSKESFYCTTDQNWLAAGQVEWAHFLDYSISQYTTYGFFHTTVLWINFTYTSDMHDVHTGTVQVVPSHIKPFLYICCTFCSMYVCNMATVYKECLLTITEEIKSTLPYSIETSKNHSPNILRQWSGKQCDITMRYYTGYADIRGGQLDDHQELHFRRQLRSQPCLYNRSEMYSTNTAHCLGECRQHHLLTTRWNTVFFENPLYALVVCWRAFLWEIPVTIQFLLATSTSHTVATPVIYNTKWIHRNNDVYILLADCTDTVKMISDHNTRYL